MAKLHIYQRNGESRYWQALVYLRGTRHRFSCRTTDRSTARQYARKRVKELEDLHNRGLSEVPESVRMSEVFDRYEREQARRLRDSSRERMMDVVRQARRWFTTGPLRDPLVCDVKPGDVQAFLEVKQSEGVTARTVNLYRANLRRVFQIAQRQWLLIPSNPVDGTEPLRQ